METTPNGWKIIDADAGVLSFTYEFTRGATANCFTARLASGGLLVISPPANITQEAAGDLAAFGPVEAIAANNGFHHLGIARWRELFPDARCFAAPDARARIAKKSKTAGALEPLTALQPLLGDNVAFVETPASKCGETWARVKIRDGYAWYASDILVNMETLPPNFVARLMFKLTKSAPGYKVFNLAHKFILKDKRAVLKAMLRDVRKHPPSVMVPAHGALLTAESIANDTEDIISDALR